MVSAASLTVRLVKNDDATGHVAFRTARWASQGASLTTHSLLLCTPADQCHRIDLYLKKQQQCNVNFVLMQDRVPVRLWLSLRRISPSVWGRRRLWAALQVQEWMMISAAVSRHKYPGVRYPESFQQHRIWVHSFRTKPPTQSGYRGKLLRRKRLWHRSVHTRLTATSPSTDIQSLKQVFFFFFVMFICSFIQMLWTHPLLKTENIISRQIF